MTKKNVLEEIGKHFSEIYFPQFHSPQIEAMGRFMEGLFRSYVSFTEGQENTAKELREAYAPDTDLGLLVLIERGDKRAAVRFARRHKNPINWELWKAFRQEFEEEVKRRRMGLHEDSGEPQETIPRRRVLRNLAISAALHGAGVLSRGWRGAPLRWNDAKKKPSRMGRKPLEKTVDLGDGSLVILREPTAPELADVLSGDAATLNDRLLRAAIVVPGGMFESPGDVEVFLREGIDTPEEHAHLLREARAFIFDCVLNARGAAFYEMNKAATLDLSGGRTRSEMVKARTWKPEIALSYDSGEEVFDGGEEILVSEGLTPEEVLIEKQNEAKLRALLERKLTPRELAIYDARKEGKTWKKIAVERGMTPAAARQVGSRLQRKISPSVR